jgi:ethanolaminephosphotransferase
MIPKQLEMDNIVRDIYTAICSKDHLRSTLLLLLGDHGMNDAGNHGGSSAGETSPAMVFISPKLRSISPDQQSPLLVKSDYEYYSSIGQSDIVPTLAGLLGFPVPRNNLGSFITEFLPFWKSSKHYCWTARPG